jgi:hypothetical protein
MEKLRCPGLISVAPGAGPNQKPHEQLLHFRYDRRLCLAYRQIAINAFDQAVKTSSRRFSEVDQLLPPAIMTTA